MSKFSVLSLYIPCSVVVIFSYSYVFLGYKLLTKRNFLGVQTSNVPFLPSSDEKEFLTAFDHA